MLSTEPG